MNIIFLVTIIGILFGALALVDRLDAKGRVSRVPLGSDLGNDRDAARLRAEIAANVDHHPASPARSAPRSTRTSHRHAA